MLIGSTVRSRHARKIATKLVNSRWKMKMIAMKAKNLQKILADLQNLLVMHIQISYSICSKTFLDHSIVFFSVHHCISFKRVQSILSTKQKVDLDLLSPVSGEFCWRRERVGYCPKFCFMRFGRGVVVGKEGSTKKLVIFW
ncbi:hypothetical protein YC2023_033741 [Brassica napus]